MRDVTLADVAVPGGLVGGPFGSSLVGADYVSEGVPVIRGTNMGERAVEGPYVYVTPRKAQVLARNAAVPGDIVFTQRGTLGQVSVVGDSYPLYLISQSQMRLRVDSERFETRFVFYACKAQRFLQQVTDSAIATGVPHINLGILARLRIPNPPRETQTAIAEVLGAIDDKIAANVALTGAGDELCRLNFAILPVMGVVRLGDVAVVNRASISPGDGEIRYLDIAGVRVGEYEWPQSMSWAEAPGRARRRVAQGDVVWSTVRPNRRSHALVLDDDPTLVASTGLAVLTPTKVGSAFLYEASRLPQFTDYLVASADGSAYPAVRAEKFLEAPLPRVSTEAQVRFESLALPIRRRLHGAAVESRKLAEIRDTLLPLLMSGQLRVRDAERAVEGVL